MKRFTNCVKCHGEPRKEAADILRTSKQPEEEQRVIPSGESSLCKGPVAHRSELRRGETRREPGAPVWWASREVWCRGWEGRTGLPQGPVVQGGSCLSF